MKKRPSLVVMFLIMLSVLAMSCSSGNHIGGSSRKCGCGVNRGMVGY